MVICAFIHMKQNGVCEIQCTNEEAVKEVKYTMLDGNILIDVSETFKIFGNLTRLKTLKALYQRKLCICDLAAVLEANQSTISHRYVF